MQKKIILLLKQFLVEIIVHLKIKRRQRSAVLDTIWLHLKAASGFGAWHVGQLNWSFYASSSSGRICLEFLPSRAQFLAATWGWAQSSRALPQGHHTGLLAVSAEVSLSIIQGPTTCPRETHRYVPKWHQPQSGICFLCFWTLKLSISWLPGGTVSSLTIFQAPAISQATDAVAETPQLPKQSIHGLRRMLNADERSKSKGRIIYRPIHKFAGLPSAARSQPAHWLWEGRLSSAFFCFPVLCSQMHSVCASMSMDAMLL